MLQEPDFPPIYYAKNRIAKLNHIKFLSSHEKDKSGYAL
jgi:hypothetical protein